MHLFSQFALLAILGAVVAVSSTAQPLRFRSIEARYDVVVLVADAKSGKLLGGIRTNEAGTARYDPGSVFKLAIVLATLRAGNVGADDTYECKGHASFGGVEHRCWNETGHGEMRLVPGIAASCNLYFRWLASHNSAEDILKSARDLSLADDGARSTTLDAETLLGEAWSVTPDDMLRLALALASRGRLARPALDLSSPRYRPLFDGLRECVRVGTAKAAWSRRFSVAGKTGTAGKPEAPRRRIGWFVGFAPFERPRYAVAVLHRKGMGSDAAAIARMVFDRIL